MARKKLVLIPAALAMLTLSGCSVVNDLYTSVEKDIENSKFEKKVGASQAYIDEANALMYEGDFAKAKTFLDKAYMLYPRQASLHHSYKEYYKFLGDQKLADLASKRYEQMVVRSKALNEKGRYAMVEMDSLELAGDLFTLSIIYHDKNTATLVNIATLGYTTGDYALAQSSLKMLSALGHMSPEASMIEFLVADALGDNKTMQIVKLIMKSAWPDSPQYKFVNTGELAPSIQLGS